MGRSAPRRSRARLAAMVAAVLGVVLLVRGVVVEPREVASESMEPTLYPGSVVLDD